MAGRSLLCTVALVIVALLASGAASAGSSAAGEPVTVVLSGWTSSPAETASLENTIAAFEASHPTINVDYRPLDNYQRDMEAQFAAGNPPDPGQCVIRPRSGLAASRRRRLV